MNYYIGIDLGTSSCKGILTDSKAKIIKIASREYDVIYPHSGWSEQNPEDWLKAVNEILAELSEGIEDDVRGISFGGQMHGLVLLDDKDEVIRPAILWNDGRTGKETEYLNTVVGKEKLSEYTANIAFAGFTAPKILWVKENEPENFNKIRKICLPKDYIAYKLTGVFSTDYSDASGMLLLDVKNKCWSNEMCEICSVKKEWLPKLYESWQVTGKPKAEYGLKNAVVTAGAGDNAAAAVGTGTVGIGDCNISLGTSGTVFISQEGFSVDKNNALHSFAHANGKWHLMGCILSAASCNKWWIEDILRSDDYDGAVSDAGLGENNVWFLPYLMGERSPHNDVDARGVFFGMSADTTREQMSTAVLEGVSFALRDCVDTARESGVSINRANLCGGGAKSKLWRKILANVLDCEITMTESEQGPSLGAAILSMVGAGEYATVEDAVEATVNASVVSKPDDALVAKYNEKYKVFKALYPALKDVYKKAAEKI
ncbi:MAG: xylulokinase [Clostridia bacterium]|nr:xylulokinase [Clostridia bacterium]